MKGPKIIEQDVLTVLATQARCYGPNLRLEGQLPRELYLRTNKVLEALGGKWNRSAKAHVFPGDSAIHLEAAVFTGTYTAVKQDFEAFYTPAELANTMILRAQISPGDLVLEPSAGNGQLACRAMGVKGLVTCVELREEACEKLRALGLPAVNCGDFLQWPCTMLFDIVLMNPPFSRCQDATHILKAAGMLKPGGRLVAIASAGVTFRTEGVYEQLRELVRAWGGTIEELPDGSFKESGTMVRTVMITMDKPL